MKENISRNGFTAGDDTSDTTIILPLTNNMVSKRVNYSNVIAFAFYKSKLILFTMPYTKTRVKDEFVPLLRDLIYPEMSRFVKGQIDTNATEYEILRPFLLKRYFLESL